MFRGKESSNRIEISRLVKDLLNFSVLGSLQLWGGSRWVGGCLGAWGMSPHMCTCTNAHVYMYRNCKWLLTWRHPCLSCLTCMCVHACACVCMHVHVCACMHACACVHMCACMGHPSYTHTHAHPHPLTCHPSRGGPLESIKIQ